MYVILTFKFRGKWWFKIALVCYLVSYKLWLNISWTHTVEQPYSIICRTPKNNMVRLWVKEVHMTLYRLKVITNCVWQVSSRYIKVWSLTIRSFTVCWKISKHSNGKQTRCVSLCHPRLQKHVEAHKVDNDFFFQKVIWCIFIHALA